MDFYRIRETTTKNEGVVIFPDFTVCRSKDLMVRGGSFYAIWDEERGLWSTDEFDAQRLIDEDLQLYLNQLKKERDVRVTVKWMRSFASGSWQKYLSFLSTMPDTNVQLDSKIIFSNTDVKKEDYASKKLKYPMKDGECKAYTELSTTLYDPEELQKLEWAVGSVIAGDSKYIQKFIVLYGESGTGKSTYLNIIAKLFEGYYITFDAKALGSASNQFSTEIFRSNPLVAIQHDGDLSRIEDNTKINSIVSHEEMVMNEKYKSAYSSRINCFLFMGTNKPVRITDAKSGIIRRLIDVSPSGRLVPENRYDKLYSAIDYELGEIASHCLNVYLALGRHYYDTYKPISMIAKTDVFYNFVEDCYDIFIAQDAISLKQAYTLYKEYCDATNLEFILPMYKFREELKNYFESYSDRARVDGQQVRSYYQGFLWKKFQQTTPVIFEEQVDPFESNCDILDKFLADCPAQYAKENGEPSKPWSKVKTKLRDLDTSKLHYVLPPKNFITLDSDLKNESGEKDYEKNIKAVSAYPETYAEVSRSGAGIHMHYIFDGDTSLLKGSISDGIELKTYAGKAALRRIAIKSNGKEIRHISSGLPLKGEKKKMINFEDVTDEMAVRNIIRSMITKNLNKEYHGDTRSSIDFIKKILDEAYDSGYSYDVRDLRGAVFSFAAKASNQADYCTKLVGKMKFCSEGHEDGNLIFSKKGEDRYYNDDRLVFFDCEVYPNLFLVCYKFQGAKDIYRVFNPSPETVGGWFNWKLVGFNCRRYDNHILYGRYIGLNNEGLFNLSKSIIAKKKDAFYGNAYDISYADVYDFSTKKQSLKKWELDLKLVHKEMELPWDQPVPEDIWEQVADYCCADVMATEAVFEHNESDWKARLIASSLSGLTPNDTTAQHVAKFLFGNDKRPQEKFIYTDLSTIFPGYEFKDGKSYYKGIETGEGGLVIAKPGTYYNVALLDIESMHPTSIEILDYFGPYTPRFSELKRARLAVKHKNFEEAAGLLGGALKPYLNENDADALAYSLKIMINIIYGFTSAKFDNTFKHPDNKDNIVAKCGALFMVDLAEAVEAEGYTVAHIKTDSIKIPDADDYIIKFVKEYGREFGYNFDHEATYDKMCLVNNAVYIAKVREGKHAGEWTATGAEFADPFIFNTLFAKKHTDWQDMEVSCQVTTAMYLNFNEEGEDNFIFVGKVGSFFPVKEGCGGGQLLRKKEAEDGTISWSAVSDTKGRRWKEASVIESLELYDQIDMEYYNQKVRDAYEHISEFCDPEVFCELPEYGEDLYFERR